MYGSTMDSSPIADKQNLNLTNIFLPVHRLIEWTIIIKDFMHKEQLFSVDNIVRISKHLLTRNDESSIEELHPA